MSLIKLDLSKVYDRMEWSFLEAVLIRLGFSRSWIKIVMQCVSTVKYSFLINGQPCGMLTSSRGLRQGDPLSPYLFLLGVEVFSALLESKAEHGLLQGIRVCDGAPVIHHLLFVEDSLCFYLFRPEPGCGRGAERSRILGVFHSVPAQITMSRCRDWGGPVFDSPMLKLALSTCMGRGMKVGENICAYLDVCTLSLFYKASMGTVALVSNVGLFALLWSVSAFGGVLPLE
ncbi:hypothetical protein ACLB2K_047377 [Fragaria x ananassa]